MKSKLLNASSLLRVFLVAVLAMFCVSCDETETTDSTGFILHYYGVTDIGPSMSYELQEPSYKGSAPYDFSITGITLNDEAYTNADNFVIDAETGKITIQNTESMPIGLYSISISCYSNNKAYKFKDAVQVNMLLAVPEGITVEPAEVLVKQEDEKWWEASAKVITDTEKHVSILKCEIAQDESKEYLKYFTIENNNTITFNPDQKDNIVPGEKYVLSLKLTTKAGEHLYPDAVIFKVISKPYNLQYKPKEVKIEKNAAHESQLPTIQGSEGMSYSIKSVSPEASGFTIDEKTGKISIAENSLSTIGAIYNIDVTVSNEYGSAEFPEVYKVTVVDFINPIDPATFSYAVPETYEEMEYAIPVARGLVGDEVVYTFADNNPEAIKEQIEKGRMSIDIESGEIYITKKNTLAPGDYTVSVKASNVKNEATTSFTLAIKANPNKFTFYYGNNLGLSPAENYANQYSIENEAGLLALSLSPTIQPSGQTIKWKIVAKSGENVNNLSTPPAKIDENTGNIYFDTAEGMVMGTLNIGMVVVEATCGTGELAYTMTAPVFFRVAKAASGVFVDYKPFVFQVNSKTGGESVAPTITSPTGTILMDYRREFNFFPINMISKGEIPKTKGSQIEYAWKYSWEQMGGDFNGGARKPISYYDESKPIVNKDHLDKLLAYINPTNKAIVINPEMWKASENSYVNGVFIARMIYDTNESTAPGNMKSGSGKQFFPIAIWLDENF